MTPRLLRSQSGFTYIAALVMVVIMGIMLSKAAVVWTTKMKGERETELIFRGSQIRYAMQRWYHSQPAAPGTPQPPVPAGIQPLRDLKDLLKDPSQQQVVRYLRPSNLIDPITGKEWGLIKDGAGGIIGVKSTSGAEPLKKGNFPDDYGTDFDGKMKYSEWEFVHNRFPKKGVQSGVKLPKEQTPEQQPQQPQQPQQQ